MCIRDSIKRRVHGSFNNQNNNSNNLNSSISQYDYPSSNSQMNPVNQEIKRAKTELSELTETQQIKQQQRIDLEKQVEMDTLNNQDLQKNLENIKLLLIQQTAKDKTNEYDDKQIVSLKQTKN
eukprot:TRINITY_DN32330_c0_g1_i1.p3 TRINITY_DN32330_c0_g1~~TRINITY_DN32330_c0_g1_i1.p3  ORF type:complete len:123 (-),score=29.37 TRINITY_DN32330_c0_g1_i1:165-533(-)